MAIPKAYGAQHPARLKKALDTKGKHRFQSMNGLIEPFKSDIVKITQSIDRSAFKAEIGPAVICFVSILIPLGCIFKVNSYILPYLSMACNGGNGPPGARLHVRCACVKIKVYTFGPGTVGTGGMKR